MTIYSKPKVLPTINEMVNHVVHRKKGVKTGSGVGKRNSKKKQHQSLPAIVRHISKLHNRNRRKNSKKPTRSRTLESPKLGGFLPLLPLIAGISALGSLAGGASAIANAVNSSKNAQKHLDENQRHNKMLEAIALGQKFGKGLFLKPYKKKLSNSKN